LNEAEGSRKNRESASWYSQICLTYHHSASGVPALAHDQMAKQIKPEIKLGATVHRKAQSGEIITGQVVHTWEEQSVPMVRVASGDLVYQRSGAHAGR
jgi:hypothetical protein